MNRYIALLRGINVGRAKRIAMADLCHMFSELGYTSVKSVLNSGNVVFDAGGVSATDAAGAIEEALVLRLGVGAKVFVLDSQELAGIVADNPLGPLATDPARLYAFLLSGEAQRAMAEELCAREWGAESLALGRRAAYVWCPEGMLDSAAATALGKGLGDGTTSRNWNTIMRLHKLCGDGACLS
ncbi:DUF1697 domain-containing protein [Massilia sp. DD77]|uniref:DUF1697 domain-containing protein n=1 Tax=Massilia sp. DD77 TaxID=3109349 RepID=UPI002FFFCB9D